MLMHDELMRRGIRLLDAMSRDREMLASTSGYGAAARQERVLRSEVRGRSSSTRLRASSATGPFATQPARVPNITSIHNHASVQLALARHHKRETGT